MSDDADKVTADDERAWDLFGRQRKAARDGTVQRDGGVPLRVWLGAAILCGLLWLAWRHFG